MKMALMNNCFNLVKYFSSIKGEIKKKHAIDLIKTNNIIVTNSGKTIQIDSNTKDFLLKYLDCREKNMRRRIENLLTESESISICKNSNYSYGYTTVANTEHHNSSKSLISRVSNIAEKFAISKNLSVNTNPQNRCIWTCNSRIFVTSRNLDGAIPSTDNPKVIWEIKEYWGKTGGGSKMSDAVYECQLIGREIFDFSRYLRHHGTETRPIKHLVFIDGKDQWQSRISDLSRLIDLEFFGYIDKLFIGIEVEEEFQCYLEKVFSTSSP